eukprot:s802_g12.t1
MAGRGFGNMVHPNAVVARRELERQALGSGAKGSGPKVIFLDLDGVLNRTRAATHIRLDEDLLRLLRDLIHRGGEDVHIVLSTYWRRFTDYITYVLSRYGISEGRVLGRTPGQGHLAGSCADDKVYESRSEEICHWLQEHPEVSGYVILDDRDTAGQGMLKPHFVHCRSDLGLTPEDVEKALEILQMPRLDLVDLGAAASPTPRRGQDLPAGPQQSGAAAELCQPGPARERPPKLVSYIAMQPRGHYPITDMMMIRNDIVKEVDYLASRMQNPPAWPPRREEEGDPYRLPRPGDRVALRGSRRRPELAGAPAQILTGADQEGFVTVRVFANPGDAGSLKQVHIEKLRPLDPPRAPTAPSQKDPSAAEAHSVSSASRGSRRSQGSGASSRRLGSSLSASGLAALRSAEAGRPRSRPPSAPAPSRRPPAPVASTHAEAGGNGSECGPRLAPDEIQSQLMKQKLSPYEASVAYASVASRSQNPLVNGRAQSAPSKIPVTYLTSPQRRLEDAYNHLPSVSEDPEEREALMEDEMILWFRVPMDGESDVLPNAFLGWKVASLASQRSRGPRPSRLHWAKACAAHEVREKSLKRCERLAGSRHQLWPWLRSWRAVAAQRPFAPSQQSPVDAGVPVSASAAGSILCRWVERSKCLSLSVAWLSWLSCMADLRRDKELRTAEEAVEKLFASCQERIASEVSRRRAVKDAALRFMASGSNENAPVVRALRAWHELVPRMKLERCEEQRRQLSQRAQKLSSAELRLLQRRNVALSRTRLRLCFVAWRLAALSRQLPALRRQAERRKVLESEATRTDRRMGYLETALSRLVQGGLAAAGAESLGLPRPPQGGTA